jgi:two-component sensor histidine kinase
MSRSVLPLSMALHELATNAAKYGALSVRGGGINVRWQLTGGIDKSVELTWTERGGPKVRRDETEQGAPNPRHGKSAGFGAVLIDRVVTHDLDGTADIDFDPMGVSWSLYSRCGYKPVPPSTPDSVANQAHLF